MRGIVIAGTHSGCGKTTVTLGIMAALRKKGITVQPFKAGPDFIDAGLHRIAADRPSRNLDQWMCGQEYVKETFARHAAVVDIAVIEGVMGMYDGDFSTASLAAFLDLPVVLVVDAYGMAESAGAVVRGFAEFKAQSSKFKADEQNHELAGVVFNRVASEGHYKRLKESVCDVPVLGYLPRKLDFEIPHRHLGLTTAEEEPLGTANIDKLAETVLTHIDIEELIRHADCRTQFPQFQTHPHPGPLPEGEGRRGSVGPLPEGEGGRVRKTRIAMASDRAFSFYYEDNLDLLSEAGAEIIRFSPLADTTVPENADAVYIGGGYPELYAGTLSGNKSMLASLHALAEAGKPVYAECGGLMYLSKGLCDFDGRVFAMAGVLPFETRMMKRPQLGYREIVLNEDCILGSRGARLRGHEFHYSEIIEDGGQGPGVRGKGSEIMKQDDIYSVQDNHGRSVQNPGGFKYKNTLASYIHVHFGSNRNIAVDFSAFMQGERRS